MPGQSAQNESLISRPKVLQGCADFTPKPSGLLAAKCENGLRGLFDLGTHRGHGICCVGQLNQLGAFGGGVGVDARRFPRFKLRVEIRVYPRGSAVVRGDTVDISESGISALLRMEVPLGEVVRLEFRLPNGEVDIPAMVRQRTAFRYGFQFVETSSAHDVIGRACRQLALEAAAHGSES